MELWTLKEAYVKALGRGISAPPGLRGFSVMVDGAGSAGEAVPCTASVVLGGATEPQAPRGVRVLACSEGSARAMGVDGQARLVLEQHAEDVIAASQVHMALLQPDAQHVGALCCVDAPGAPLGNVRMWHVAPW